MSPLLPSISAWLFYFREDDAMNTYQELKEKHQQEVNQFPMAFAFSDKQFTEGMAKLGLTPEQTDLVYKLGDTGGFYRRTDAPALHELMDRHERERQAALDSDQTGADYIMQMFCYELVNHEYFYTGRLSDTLDACDLTTEDLEKNPKFHHGLNLALKSLGKKTRKVKKK
jgi:hypothetical protein